MQHLAPFIVMIVLLIIIAVIIITILNHNLKKRLIELGLTNPEVLNALTGSKSKFEALKWGLILFFGGLGLVVIEFLPYPSTGSSLPYGVEAVFLAAGFLIYYLLIRNHKD